MEVAAGPFGSSDRLAVERYFDHVIGEVWNRPVLQRQAPEMRAQDHRPTRGGDVIEVELHRKRLPVDVGELGPVPGLAVVGTPDLVAAQAQQQLFTFEMEVPAQGQARSICHGRSGARGHPGAGLRIEAQAVDVEATVLVKVGVFAHQVFGHQLQVVAGREDAVAAVFDPDGHRIPQVRERQAGAREL